jgi:hypothetical protein
LSGLNTFEKLSWYLAKIPIKSTENLKKNMNFTRKLSILYFVFFCCQSYANELSTDLHKACVTEQLSLHKGIKGHAIEASNFNEYCKCETDYIMSKATQEQLNQILKKQAIKPNWLPQFKSNALKNCTAQEKQITT